MKIFKSTLTILVTAFLVWFVWNKLQHNKAQMEETARLASQINDIFPVEVEEVKMKLLKGNTDATGKLMPNKLIYLISDTQGKVTELKKRKGAFVKRGEVIAKVNDEGLQNQLALANSNLEKLKTDRQRLENLLAGEAATKRQLEEIELGIKNAETNIALLKENIGNTTIKSPMTGHISMLFIELGSFVGGGMQVAEIVDVTRLKLLARVSEELVIKLRNGQRVEILVEVFPDQIFTGVISLIAVKADFGGKYQVEISITDNKNLPLKAGMFAKVKFNEGEKEALVIPRKAVIGSIQAPQVFVIEDGRASLRTIKVGVHDSYEVEVTEGLKIGEQVVVNGKINLAEGTKVEIR